MAGRVYFTLVYFALLAVACAFSLALVEGGQAEPVRGIPEARSSVALIIVRDAKLQSLRQGNGFIVGEGLIATNLQLIEGARSISVKLKGDDRFHESAGIANSNEEHNLALLWVPTAKAAALEIADSRQVSIGDRVYALSNPTGLEGTLSEGVVSGERKVGATTLLHVTAPISSGTSGGPILNLSGQVIGIGVAKAVNRGGEAISFAIPSSHLAALLDQPSTLTSGLSASGGRDAPAVEAPPLPERRGPLPAIAAEPGKESIAAEPGKEDVSAPVIATPLPERRDQRTVAIADIPLPEKRVREREAAPDAYHVQIAALQSEDAALRALAALRQRFPHLLNGQQEPDIQVSDLGPKGVWFRVRLGPIGERVAANKLCQQLKAAGADCLVTH